jgi:hypothetical protein
MLILHVALLNVCCSSTVQIISDSIVHRCKQVPRLLSFRSLCVARVRTSNIPAIVVHGRLVFFSLNSYSVNMLGRVYIGMWLQRRNARCIHYTSVYVMAGAPDTRLL